MKKYITIGLIAVLLLSAALVAVSARGNAPGNSGKGYPVIYVTEQDKCYQSIIGPTLPYNEGNAKTFELLEMGVGPTGLQTKYGPTDTEYNGGKWWVDQNGNGEMDPEGPDDGNQPLFLLPVALCSALPIGNNL